MIIQMIFLKGQVKIISLSFCDIHFLATFAFRMSYQERDLGKTLQMAQLPSHYLKIG